MNKFLSLKLLIWRQLSTISKGYFEEFLINDISPDNSILELLDILNDDLIHKNERPIYFEHDCREGICGSCGFIINGMAHGPNKGTTACQLYLRNFKNNSTITLEPWRANSFPIIKDLAVDRSSLDRIISSGGFLIEEKYENFDANNTLINPKAAFSAFQAATCIGCGACVASCRNASASLFTAAKLAHLAQLPQGTEDNKNRINAMNSRMQIEGFGSCSNNLECEAVCPKEISADWISWMNGQL